MNIVRVSPTGQITFPSSIRKRIKTNQLKVEMRGRVITLSPAKDEQETLASFSSLGRPSFEFWNNRKDDVYQAFYEQA